MIPHNELKSLSIPKLEDLKRILFDAPDKIIVNPEIAQRPVVKNSGDKK